MIILALPYGRRTRHVVVKEGAAYAVNSKEKNASFHGITAPSSSWAASANVTVDKERIMHVEQTNQNNASLHQNTHVS